MAPPADVDDGSLRAIESHLFARWGEGRLEPSTDRIAALLDLLGDPQRAYRAFHLTGTNGKTTTARMIDELMRGFGLRTGRYTSPHLTSVTERIVIDGEPITAERFVDVYAEIAPYLDLVDKDSDVKLSFFEVITALGFAAFADAPVDIAVVEVGLGGRWDATNQLDAEVAVITPIGLDHTEYLGDTVDQIATEKAGIIKSGATAVLAAQPAQAMAALMARCAEVGADVAREGTDFGVTERREAVGGQQLTLRGLAGVYDEIFLPLYGAHQAQNAACALVAVEAFFGADASSGPIDVDVVRAAFATVQSPGRLERVRSAPTVLVDATHNPHGMTATVTTLRESFDFRRLVAVFGALEGKDARGMLTLLEPQVAEVVVTQSSSDRSMTADALAGVAVEVFGAGRVVVEPDLDTALATAIGLADEDTDDVPSGAGVLVTGSVVIAGEARAILVRSS